MPVLGLRGTGSWSTGERPTNFREEILYLKPNTKAPLMALLGKMQDEKVNDPKFTWFEKGLPNQQFEVEGSQTDSDTAIEGVAATTPGKMIKKGHVLLNVRTQEVMWVTADPADPWEVLTVSRGKGSVAAAMNDGDILLVIGSAHMEGDPVPTAVSYDPAEKFNYCQIFRNVIFLTKTGVATQLRTGKPLKEALRELVEIHGMEMEKAAFFGTRLEQTSGAQPQRTTGGLLYFITTNVKDFADAVSIDALEDWAGTVMMYGSNERIIFCGSVFLTVLARLARQNSDYQFAPTQNYYGMSISEYRTPFGTWYLKPHPLFNETAAFRDWGVIVDMDNIRYRYLRDTTYNPEVQNKGDDARKDEYLTEAGFEIHHEKTMAVFKNASSVVA